MTGRGTRFLLFLYPRDWRRRFAHEWSEIVEWRQAHLRDSTLGGFRLFAGLLVDTLRAVPAAYASVIADRIADFVRGRRNRRTQPGGQYRGGRYQAGRVGPGSISGALSQDFRFAVRSLIRNPLFTCAAVSSLALGIGPNTAIFSIVNAVLLHPLPYHQPDRLAIVWNEFPKSGLARLPLSGVELQALQQRANLFEDAGGIWATTRTVLGPDEPATVSAGLITPNFFTVIGVPPALGRTFTRDETGTGVPTGAIVSNEFWRSHLGADPGAIGTSLTVDGADVSVVGIMPAGFKLFFPPDGGIPERLDIYLPLPWELSRLPPDQQFLRVIGRLDEGVDLSAAQRQVATVASGLRQTYPEIAATGDRFSVVPLHAETVRAARPVLLALMGGVGLFLLLASANVASLILARTTTRGREMAVRVSLGASKLRLAQMLVVESALITALGAIAGFWVGTACTDLLWGLRPEGIARIDSVHPDLTVLVFTVGVSAVAGILFGLAPLAQMSALRPIRSLRLGNMLAGRGSVRARKIVTATEIGVALVLLIGAGLMIQTFAKVRSSDPGFEPEGVLTFKVALALRRFPEDEERARLAYELERTLRELPGVEAAGATSHLPFADWANWGGSAAPEGVAEAERDAYFVDHRSITPGYIGAIGARLIAGRDFAEEDDRSSEPSVIIDRTYADRTFPGGGAIGKRLYATRYRDGVFENTWAVVVGVADDVRDRSPSVPSAGQVFWPFAQSARWELTYVVRTVGDPGAILDDVRGAIAGLQRNLAPLDVRTMDEYVADATAQNRFVALLGAVFSSLAFVLGALGLYGVITYSTAQRSQELGIRVVVGARTVDIVKDVVREGVLLGLSGVAIGVVAAFGLTRFLGSLLYDVSPTDPATFIGTSLAFLAIAVCASVGPALRATRVDPLESMRV